METECAVINVFRPILPTITIFLAALIKVATVNTNSVWQIPGLAPVHHDTLVVTFTDTSQPTPDDAHNPSFTSNHFGSL